MQAGLKNFESDTWQGVLVPARTHLSVVARLNAELIKVIRCPEIRARLTGQGPKW